MAEEDVVSPAASEALMLQHNESSDAHVWGEVYWWGFELSFNSAAVTRLNTISALIVAAAAFLPHPVPNLVAGVVAVRALAYEAVAGDGGLVLASPWPMPLMLAPVRAAKLPNDKMEWTVFSEGTWSSPAKFNGANYTAARPSFATYRNDLYLLHRGSGDESIWYMKYDPDLGWGDSTKVPSCTSHCDVAACEYRGKLHVVHRGEGNDSCLLHVQFDGSSWGSDSRMSHKYTASGPALAVFNGGMYCVARGTEDLLWVTRYDGYSWSQYTKMGGGHMFTSSGPALAVFDGALYCVARGMENLLWWTRYDGNSWSTYTKIGGGSVYSSAAPSLCVFKGRLFCVARGMEGLLWWTVYDGSTWRRYLAADFQVGDYGPALVSYKNSHSQRDEELLCAFKGN